MVLGCRLIFAVNIVLCTIQLSFGQQFSLRQFTAKDGLPQSQVTCVLEDKLGYLWFGTIGGGLGRYDGTEFKTYNTFDGLVSNTIIGMLLDSKDQLWVCHPHGISKFEANGFKKYLTPEFQTNEGKLRRFFLWNDSICFVTLDGKWGSIYNDKLNPRWAITNRTTLTVTPSQKSIVLALDDSSLLIKEKHGTSIISHKKDFYSVRGVFDLKGQTIIESERGFFTLDQNKQLRPIQVPFKNRFMKYDSVGNFYWTESNNNLIKEANHIADTILKASTVYEVVQDMQGNWWFATNGAGLFRYAKQDFDRCGSRSLRLVMSILKDHSDATWIGTMENGLRRIHKNKVERFALDGNLYANVTDIKQNSKGQIWVASNDGLGFFSNNKFTMIKSKHGLLSDHVRCIDFDEKGHVWAGTARGVSCVKDGAVLKNYSIQHNLLDQQIYSIHYHSSNGTLYVGSEYGINSIIDNQVGSIQIPELKNATILSINGYKNDRLLIGSAGAGVCVYNLIHKTKSFINSKSGLPSDLIYFIAADEQDFVWVGTERGINKLRLNEKSEITENIYYGIDNGLEGMETNHNAYFLGKQKYFGLVDGLYEYNQTARFPSAPNKLHFTDVQLFYGGYSAAPFSKQLDGFFQIPQKPVFPNSQNHITFYFNRVDKLFAGSIKYKYILENFDVSWSRPSLLRQVTYSNLPPGVYTFKVKATNSQGKWDEKALEYPFTIKAAFYQTTLFRILLAVLILGGVVLWIYLRIRLKANEIIRIEQIKFHEKEVLRKDFARDFHDEMGNQLTRIINYVSLLKLASGQKNGQNELYEKVEASAKILYSGTRDFIWAIDPNNDDLLKVFIHIKDFAEGILKEKDIDFRSHSQLTSKVSLPYGSSRQIILIFKEAITNVFEHSRASSASLYLGREGKKFTITLKDNGTGFDLTSLNELRGLRNMRNRAERIEGSLRITSSTKESGTTIVLLIGHYKEKYHDITI